MGSIVSAVGRHDASEVDQIRLAVQPPGDEVADLCFGEAAVGANAIGFHAVVAIGGGLDDQGRIHRAVPTLVDVDRVVVDVNRSVVGDVHRAAKELNAVIEHGIDFQVTDDGVATHSAEGDAV